VRLTSLTTFAIVLATAAPSSADDLSRAQKQWDAQEYELVIEAADAALAGALDRDHRIEALRLKGSAHAVLGDDEPAVAVFEQILDIDARFRMPVDSSPRIMGVFMPARSRWMVRREAELRDELGKDLYDLKFSASIPEAGTGGRALSISMTLDDPKHLVADIVVFYRRAGASSYSTLTTDAAHGTRTVDIPAVFTEADEAYRLEMFVEALHESGVVLRREGVVDEPISLPFGAGQVPQPTPIYKKWWFWASAAAVAIAVPFLVDQAMDVGPQDVHGGGQ
jgi:hypothetical protein